MNQTDTTNLKAYLYSSIREDQNYKSFWTRHPEVVEALDYIQSQLQEGEQLYCLEPGFQRICGILVHYIASDEYVPLPIGGMDKQRARLYVNQLREL